MTELPFGKADALVKPSEFRNMEDGWYEKLCEGVDRLRSLGVNRLAKLGSGGRRNDSVCLEAVCFAAERNLPPLQE